MKSSKEKRDFLLKSKPHVRVVKLHDENGLLSEDMGLLWAAYQRGGFPVIPRNLDQNLFVDIILDSVKGYSSLWMIEDDCRIYRAKRGATAFVGVYVTGGNGWTIEPHVEWFPWATSKHILRGSVAFFQMMRYSKDVGVCLVKSLGNTANLFHRLKDYGVLFYVGKIPNGDIRGDEYLFTVKGKRNEHRNDGYIKSGQSAIAE